MEQVGLGEPAVGERAASSSADHVDPAARSANPYEMAVAADPLPFYRQLRQEARPPE